MNIDNRTSLFDEPVVEIIRRRRSVRTYSKMPIPGDIKEKVHQCWQQLEGPFPVRIRFEWLDKPEMADARIKLGTYGIIQGASSFIAAAIEKKEHNLEQLGYVFENLILYLTSLGLGTCWMAGTFKKSQFSKAMRIADDELLPIVTPVGYASEKRSLIEFLMKPSPNPKKRKSWNEVFFKDSFNTPLDEADAGAYGTPLEMVRLAPSASNKQPWRIVRTDGHFNFYLAHDALYARIYSYDIQKIDMGIAMFHLESTAKESGLKGRWEIETPGLEKVPRGWEYIITWVSE